jgi:GNAT superfamily N-acetyltransferase
MPRFFRLFVDASIENDGAFATDDLTAVSLWFPPGADLDAEAASAFERDVKKVAGAYAESGPLAIVRATDAVHPIDPHWYLAFVCTRPQEQGRGLGTRLIRHVLNRGDSEGSPAYLEATSERNRELYGRLGFRESTSIELPNGPTMWGMWRAAARGSDL